jgi:tetratricopeptide (TPR) repeat protein
MLFLCKPLPGRQIMTTLKFIIIFLLIAVYSCTQKSSRRKIDPAVVRFSNQIIPLVNYLDNPDSCEKALSFLDSATTIDSNCFSCYYNKIMFLNGIKQYERAIEAINACMRIKPMAPDLYLTAGYLYELIGDTVSSTASFEKSLAFCDKVLDTMGAKNSEYEMIAGFKAVDLIMLDDSVAANLLLNKLYERQTEQQMKEMTLSIMHKNKRQLLQFWKRDQGSTNPPSQK